jgi:hypothetical protein
LAGQVGFGEEKTEVDRQVLEGRKGIARTGISGRGSKWSGRRGWEKRGNERKAEHGVAGMVPHGCSGRSKARNREYRTGRSG